MSLLLVIVSARVPSAFVIFVDWLAGRLALDFSWPWLLFVASAGMSIGELRAGRFFLGIALGFAAIHVAAFTAMTAMFTVQYKVYTEESDATLVLSTALSIATVIVLAH